MTNQLVVIALYPIQDEITQALFEAIAASECEKIEVTTSMKGDNEMIATLTLSGSWAQLTRFKTRFSLIQKNYLIEAIVKDMQPISYSDTSLPYQAYITTIGKPNSIDLIVRFFLTIPLIINDISVSHYKAPLTQTTMLDVQLTFITMLGKSINDYRETILHFCDENNFEIILEPKRV